MLLLHRMPKPDTYPPEAADRCPQVLETWLAYAPHSRPEARDFEDWVEQAYILHELNKHGPVTILPAHKGYCMSGDLTPSVARRPGAPEAIMYGIFSAADSIAFPVEADLMWNNAEATRVVQDYAHSPIFLAHAGRAFHICDMDRSSIMTGLNALHASGVREGFIKSRAKGFARRFTLPEDPAGLWKAMDPEDDISWMTVSHEGQRNALYLQAAFKPIREYRVVVVGNRAVCGAGCIESYTPADSHGNIFDDRMEYYRNSGGIVVDVDTAERYRRFAEAYAREWAAHHGAHMAYSLDLSLDADTGEIVPIEMNPLLNLGLYANRPDLIVEAMLNVTPAARAS